MSAAELVRRTVGATLAIAIALGLASCAADGPRPLTADEADRLSVTRFLNYSAPVRSLSFEVTDAGTSYRVDGWVDYSAGLGYALASGDGERALIAWTATGISSHPAPTDATAAPPLPPPDVEDDADTWTTSELLPAASRLHALLALALVVGQDRPDNPLLLRQTDAQWLREDTVGRIPATVIAGPTSDQAVDPAGTAPESDATVRYWIDADGRLLRLETRLGGDGAWIPLSFADADDVRFADAFSAGAGS